MSQRVLITGGLGYLGTVVAPYLSERSFDVTVMDAGFFKDSTLFESSTIKTVFKDVRDITKSDLEGFDVVVHLAGISNDPFGNLSAEKIYDPTRVYARNVAKLCKDLGIRFIFASSCSIYGKASGKVLDEQSETNPQTPYSQNKLDIEEDLEDLADNSFSPIALRFATAFGLSSCMRFDIVINMLAGMAVSQKQIILNSDGEAWRPNVHIDDIAQSIFLAINSTYHEGRLLVVNVGREDNNMKIIDIAKIVSREAGDVPILFLDKLGNDTGNELIKTKFVKDGGEDNRNYRVAFEKMKKVFPDFVSKYSIQRGVSEMVKKFEELQLDVDTFKNSKFYRLQTLEALHQKGIIDDDLRVVNREDL